MVQMEWWVYALGSAPVGALISGLVLLGDRMLARKTSDADRRAATRLDYDNTLFKKREEAFDAAQTALLDLADNIASAPFDTDKTVDTNWIRKQRMALVSAERLLQRYAPSTTQPLRDARNSLADFHMNIVRLRSASDDVADGLSAKISDNIKKITFAIPREFNAAMHADMKKLPLED